MSSRNPRRIRMFLALPVHGDVRAQRSDGRQCLLSMGAVRLSRLVLLATLSASLGLCGCARTGDRQGGTVTPSPASGTAAASSGLVPWIDAAAPAIPTFATSTPPPPPANARPCAASDVLASLAGNNGAGGHSVRYVRFRNVSRSTCLLVGYPKVTATAPGRPDATAANGSFFQFGHAANLPPGNGVSVLGLETDSQCAAHPGGISDAHTYSRVVVDMRGGGAVTLTFPANGLAGSLDLSCGLHLTTFEDPDYPQPQAIVPLTGLIPTLVLPRTARAGETLFYEVDVRNPTPHPVRLEPCPGYFEDAGSKLIFLTYALNCATVQSIPAGRTARYAMQLPLPSDIPAGPVQIRWGLRLPDSDTESTIDITH